MNLNLPHRKKPCSNCPYRKDSLKGWLGEESAKKYGKHADSFVCHKNTSLQCAGHMLINGDSNAYVRLSVAIGIDLELTGSALVFDSIEEFIEHHS